MALNGSGVAGRRVAAAALAGVVAVLVLGACDRTRVIADVREVDVVATSSPGGGQETVGYVTYDAAIRLVGHDGIVTVGELASDGIVLLDGSDTVRIARGDVPEAAYTAVRIVFSNVQAQVDDGLTVGGVPVVGVVRVGDLPADTIVVERPFPVATGVSQVRVLVDVKAREWLTRTDPATQRVTAAEFAATVAVGTW